MSIVLLSSPEDLETWKLYAWLFWIAVVVLLALGSSGKNVLGAIINITVGIVLEIIIVIILIAFKRIYPDLFDTIFTWNLVYIDVFVCVALTTIMGMSSYMPPYFNYWDFIRAVLLLYGVLRFWETFGLGYESKLNDDAHKFRWIILNFFIMAPMTTVAALFNQRILTLMMGNKNETANVLPSESSDAEESETITFPIDEPSDR